MTRKKTTIQTGEFHNQVEHNSASYRETWARGHQPSVILTLSVQPKHRVIEEIVVNVILLVTQGVHLCHQHTFRIKQKRRNISLHTHTNLHNQPDGKRKKRMTLQNEHLIIHALPDISFRTASGYRPSQQPREVSSSTWKGLFS